MLKQNATRTPSRPTGGRSTHNNTSLSLSSLSTRRLLNRSRSVSTPNYILRKRYVDIIEQINIEILDNIDRNNRSRINNNDTETVDDYISNAIRNRVTAGNNNKKIKKKKLSKSDFDDFIKNDLKIKSWTSTKTETFFRYHESLPSNLSEGNTPNITIETTIKAIIQLYDSNDDNRSNEYGNDPILRKEMSSSRIKAVKRNISVNAIAERASLKHKLIENEKLYKLDEKWKNFENRLIRRRQQNKVSPAKAHAINKFEQIMKKLKKKRMMQSGKNVFDLEATFKEIDESGDGCLNRDELNIAMSRLDVPLSEKELDDFMLVLDPDGSGEVEICEFAYLYYNRRKLKHGSLHATNSDGPSNYSMKMAKQHEEKIKKAKMKFLQDEKNRLKKLEQKWKNHEMRQKNKQEKHKMAEENIIRDTLFECFVNHMLSNKNWYGYVLKQIPHLRSTNNLNVDLEEFLGIIIHSNGHGEYVSQKTRNAIVQIMAPDRHTNTVDIEEFEFIMKYHAKKRNVKFNRFDGYKSFDRPNKSNMRNDAIEKTLNFNATGSKQENGGESKNEMYGTAYVMILKGLDLISSSKSNFPTHHIDTYVNVRLNNDYVGTTATIWKTEQPEFNHQFSFPIKNINMGNTLKIRVMESLENTNGSDIKRKKRDKTVGFSILPLKEFDNGISNDQWIMLKVPAVKRNKKKKKGKTMKGDARKYNPMLRVLIRIVQNEISFDGASKKQIQMNNFIEKYLVECKVNGSNVYMSMSDGALLFLVQVLPPQIDNEPNEPNFQVISSFPLWSCKIKIEEKDSSLSSYPQFTIISSAGNVYSVLLMTENGSSWLREIRHAQHEYLQRLGLPTVESMIGVNTLLGIDPGIGDTDTNPHPWVHSVEANVPFGPGRLGLELRQRIFEGEEAIGAIIKSFKPGENGKPGQAFKSGILEKSMCLYSCNDIKLYDKTFQAISECLQEESRPYTLKFIPDDNTWKKKFEKAFAENIFFACVLINNTNRSTGWLTVSKTKLSFIAMGLLNESRLDIPLSKVVMIEVHDISFIRAMHIYTESKMYRFSSMRFPNLIKQHILEAKYALEVTTKIERVKDNQSEDDDNYDNDEFEEFEEVVNNKNTNNGIHPKPPTEKPGPSSAVKGRKGMSFEKFLLKDSNNNNINSTKQMEEKTIVSPFLEIKKESFQVVGVFGKGVGKQKSFYERVKHGNLKSNYCMKILPLKQAVSDQMAREIGILEHTLHPYLQRSFALYNTKESVAILMDYLPNSLRDLVQKGLSSSEELVFASKIFSAMEYLHSLDIVHRGVEIDNVLIGSNGIPKVVNFKNSKFLAEEHTYTMCGSPEYMSPNRLLGVGHGLDSDLWAMGIFMYELHEKQNPFYDESDSQMYKNIMNCIYKASTSKIEGMQEFITTLFQRPGAIDRASLRKMKVWADIDWKAVDLNLKVKSTKKTVEKDIIL